MTTVPAPKVHVGMVTCKGSIVQAEINEAPMCVSISTDDVSVQVAVPNWSGERVSRSSGNQIPGRNAEQSFPRTPVLDGTPNRTDGGHVQPT